jgi:protocatechuate 3,4-dioxygenase alpha subunit
MLVRTPSQTVGPFYSIGLCRRDDNELVAPGEPGAIALRGELLDGDGLPVTDGMVEIWQAADRRWGRCGTSPDGAFSFVITKPEASSAEAPHLHVLVFARGLLKHQLTRMYFPDEVAANEADPVLATLDAAQRRRLVAKDEGDGLRFDIRLQGEAETVFFAT